VKVIPLIQLLAYYVILGLMVWVVTLMFPGQSAYLPFGGSLEVGAGVSEFVTGKVNPISWEPLEQSIRLALSLLGVILLMQPIAWVYIGARRRRGKEQSFILTLFVLPLAVAGIVLIVQNSLALAFSLAGIVAGVRFRLTLEDTLDAVYIFAAIGVGLAAGIQALEIAFVVSLFFNVTVLGLWQLDYAEDFSGARWFTRQWRPSDSEKSDSEKSDSEKKDGAKKEPAETDLE